MRSHSPSDEANNTRRGNKSNKLGAFSRDHGVAALIGHRDAACNLALGPLRQPYDAVRGPGLRRRGVYEPRPISAFRQENVSHLTMTNHSAAHPLVRSRISKSPNELGSRWHLGASVKSRIRRTNRHEIGEGTIEHQKHRDQRHFHCPIGF
jgi:hypothetical protein